MKNSLLAAIAILGMSGCKDASDEKKTEQPVVSTAASGAKAPVDTCSESYLVVNKSTFASEQDYNDWVTQNHVIVCSQKLNPNTCTHKKDMIDLLRMFPGDRAAQAAWLGAHTDRFCFDESFDAIERSHKIQIDGTDLDERLDAAAAKHSITVADMMAQGIDFDTDFYRKYLVVGTDSQGNFFVKKDAFDIQQTCYSLPFMKSILVNNNITDFSACTFTFARIDVPNPDGSTSPTYAFKMVYKGTMITYYDYSTKPGLGVMYNLM